MSGKKKKQNWSPGDMFVVPLEDGTYGQGQVILFEREAMNSALCAFSSERTSDIPHQIEPFTDDSVVAVLFVTRDLLDSGRWAILNNAPLISWRKYIDFEKMRSNGFIGTRIIGSYNVVALLSAYHKLVPWDNFYDPRYLDGLLVSLDRKPADVVRKSDPKTVH